jgi:SAM-dependent methyltransferase
VVSGADRIRRERAAYDRGSVHERSDAWHRRASHVLECANTRRGDELWKRLIRDAVSGGGRVLDVGCGTGFTARRAHESGASYVLGIDISEHQLAGAWSKQIPGALEFRVASALEPLGGDRFDLIVGRSVLHHVDLRTLLDRVAQNSLAPGGRMLWMEPLAHPLTLAFHKLVPSAHTPDESPLKPTDLRWIQSRFPGTRVFPINLVSFPVGVLSSLVFATADNWLMRGADDLDQVLLGHPAFVPYARQGIIAIPGRPRSVRRGSSAGSERT